MMSSMEVRLHIGVHKTGSTRMQNELKRRRDHMRTRSISVFCPRKIRARKFWSVGFWVCANDYFKDIVPRNNLRNIAAAVASSQASGVGKVIFSDENLTGSIDRILATGCLYPNIGARLSSVAEQFDGYDTSVILSVRNYADFLASLYAHRTRRRSLPDFSTLKPQMMELQRRWGDVVSDVSDAFPMAEILVIPFEKAIEQGHNALCYLVGEPRLKAMSGDRPAVLASPSGAAVEALNARRGLRRGTMASRRKILSAYPRQSFPKFDPWSEAEKAQLDAAYMQDLEILENIKNSRIQVVDLSVLPKRSSVRKRAAETAEPSNANI